MGFLTAIGSGFVRKFAEYTIEPIGRHVGYISHYKSNVQNLRTQVEDLDAAKDGVQHEVDQVIRKGKRIETSVENWKTKVDAITGEANEFLKDEGHAQTKCLHGFCPNLMLRYKLSRKSTKLAEEVGKLYGEKDFSKYGYDVPPQDVYSISPGDYNAFDSRVLVVKRIMDELRMNSDTRMIGVYGIGGVGKTTLAKEVFRQATQDTKLFDDVVIVLDVKEIPNLEGIQKRIVEKLGMDIHGEETIDGRARRLCDRIRDKKILVILDDVWERVDLEAIGLPHLATCKILLTSRSRMVLSSGMHTQKEFMLDVLDDRETWNLFEQMAGDIVKDPTIRMVATQVAEKCGGLPVLVVAVASVLKNRSTLPAWKDALRRLKGFDNEELTRKTYLALEWSYNQLDDEELKPLFLLCAGRSSIALRDLLKYGMGLGLFKNVDTVEEARNALLSLVEKLKDFCLLLDDGDNTRVRMHDVVRDVAMLIASRDQHVLSVAFGGELKQWPDEDFIRRCTMISLPRCSIPKLPEVLQCPELKMFFLNNDGDESLEIPRNFFEEMRKLKVLDLTNVGIPSLPSSLQFLLNLRTLCLDGCNLGDIALVGQLSNLEILSFVNSNFKQLPKEIGQLTSLRLLDLANCSNLKVISPNVISSLHRLEDLRMRNSFKQWEGVGVHKDERRNASLSELKHLSQLTALEIHIPDANLLPADLFCNMWLERYQIFIGDAWKWDWMGLTTLNTLKLNHTTSSTDLEDLNQGLKMLLKRSEDLYLDGTKCNNNTVHHLYGEGFHQLKHLHVQNNADFTYIISGKVVLPNLTTLRMTGCHRSRFLLSSSMARSLVQLKHLQISRSVSLEEVVSMQEYGEESTDNMFCKLEHLQLMELPNLTRFCSGNYIEFPSLEKLELVNCTKLEAFVSDHVSTSSTICREIEQRVSNEINHDVETGAQSFLFDEKVKFASLEILVISKLPKLRTIFVDERRTSSTGEIHSVRSGTFAHLKFLGLQNIYELMNLGKENTQVAGPIVPNLEILEVLLCPRLKILESSAISFQNLTTLKVIRCQGLEYLTTYSVAKSLMQLTRMVVYSCERMTQIIVATSNGDGGAGGNYEIAFSRLQHLELGKLPRLQGFGSGDCIVKFPSLQILQMSNRLKLKIFSGDETLQITYQEVDSEVDDDDDDSLNDSYNAGISRRC